MFYYIHISISVNSIENISIFYGGTDAAVPIPNHFAFLFRITFRLYGSRFHGNQEVRMERSGMTWPAGTPRAFRLEALTALLCDVGQELFSSTIFVLC
jgi:hypothetical protein